MNEDSGISMAESYLQLDHTSQRSSGAAKSDTKEADAGIVDNDQAEEQPSLVSNLVGQ